MIDVNDLRKGAAFELDGDLFLVLDYSHNKPGRGNATVRVKVRNLRSGALFDKTFTSGDRVEDISVDNTTVQYLYHDGDPSTPLRAGFYHFMDTQSYEQLTLDEKMLEDVLPYLKENMEVRLKSHNGEPLGIEMPVTVDLIVADAPLGLTGDTAAGGGTKIVTMETGLKVTTPLFVNTGDTLRIDTRTGAYITRV
jgi:elongation factor P